ncbi:MAG: DNA repair protein RecN [Pseudomonadota bacterium]
MLSDLAIKNFAIIDDLRICFKDGFSILTGETGAGKSIIIEAVNLLLGSRASSDLVRNGCDQAELEAFFDLDEDSMTSKILAQQGIDVSDGLIIRRVVSSSGKSRVFINSRQSSLDLLKKITQDLAGISSQHAHQGLLKEENHLDILDEFAETMDLKNKVKTLYKKLVPLTSKILELKQSLENKQKEQDFIQFQIDEIQKADIGPNEDEILEKKRKSLLNASQIFEVINRSIHELHEREGSMVETLSVLSNEMQKFVTADERLEKMADRLSSALYDLQDITDELRGLSSTIDLDPGSLEMIDQRLDIISRLKRKYGGSLDALFEKYQSLEEQLSQTNQIENKIKAYEQESKEYLRLISIDAQHLSGLRQTAAQKLSALAQKELEALEMGQAQFNVQFSNKKAQAPEDIATSKGEKIGPDGMDSVRFLLSPNPGEPLKPLVKIVSGGELSRIVLALKVVLSKRKSLETLIFDEVDAGIGGATSERVGLKLKELSKKHQVICITHLAQIAKYGTSQFRISKDVVDGRTFTTIIPLLDETTRVEEIARMIGGAQITDATLTHARELLKQGIS